MALLLTTDGGVQPHKPGGDAFTLEEAQAAVGGYVELVRPLPPVDQAFGGSVKLIVNEEGRLNDMPLNPVASMLAGQPIVGSVLICAQNDGGDWISLTEEEQRMLLEFGIELKDIDKGEGA
jgi:hypothetical protein